MNSAIKYIKTISWRKRAKNEQNGHFNMKLENQKCWNDTFEYPFLCEIIQVVLPKISVSQNMIN